MEREKKKDKKECWAVKIKTTFLSFQENRGEVLLLVAEHIRWRKALKSNSLIKFYLLIYVHHFPVVGPL